MRCLDSIISSMDTSLSNLGEVVKDREAWRAVVRGIAKSWTQLSEKQEQRKPWAWRKEVK